MELSIPALAQRIPTEAAAYEFLEELRWHGEPVCPHCGSIAQHYFLTPKNGTSRKTNRGSDSQRRVWCCKDCRKQFSVLTGTLMHGTHIPVRTWVFVTFELCANKNGLAAREVQRKYKLTPKSAWFLLHRIREAMMPGSSDPLFSGVVVADETWIGGAPKNRHGHRSGQGGRKTDKTPVLTLVHHETGEVRSQVVPNVNGRTLRKVIREQVDMSWTLLHTDESRAYNVMDRELAGHESVNHSAGEYFRQGVSTNKAENYFSQLKRSIDGTHHNVSKAHLGRYLSEFDFRHTTHDLTDTARMQRLMGRVAGRRLMYSVSSVGA